MGFHGSNDPINSIKNTEGNSGPKDQASIPLSPPHRVTIMKHIIYGNKHKIHMYTKMNLAQWNGPSETKRHPENC